MKEYVILDLVDLHSLFDHIEHPYLVRTFLAFLEGKVPAAEDPITLYIIEIVKHQHDNTVVAPHVDQAYPLILEAIAQRPDLHIADLRSLSHIPDGIAMLLVLEPTPPPPSAEMLLAEQREQRWQSLYNQQTLPTKPWRVMRFVQPNYDISVNWQFYNDVEGEFDDETAARKAAESYSDNGDGDLIGLFHQDTLVFIYLTGQPWTPLTTNDPTYTPYRLSDHNDR